MSLACEQLDANVQFCRSGHGSDSALRFATRRVLLHRRLQNEEAGNIIRIAITATEYLLELLRLGQLFQKILVNSGSERRVEVYLAGINFIDFDAPLMVAPVPPARVGFRKRSWDEQLKL